MKNKHISLNRILSIIVTVIIVSFVLLQSTPKMAIRTNLIIHGYIHSAFSAKIVKSNEDEYGAPKTKATRYLCTVYYVIPSPLSKQKLEQTIPKPNRFIVKSFGLSFAEMTYTDLTRLK